MKKTRSMTSAMIVVAIAILSSCDMVIFNEEAARGAREAASMKELSHFEISDWDEYGDGDNEILHPRIFLPDTAGGTSGYLIATTEDDKRLEIFRVRRGTLSSQTQIWYGGSRGLFQWSARVLPLGPDAEFSGLPLEVPLEPPLLIVTSADEHGVDARLVYPDPFAPEQILYWSDLDLRGLLLAQSGLNDPRVFAVQAIPGEIQILARDAGTDPPGPLREYFIRADGDDLISWDFSGQDPFFFSADSWSAGASSVPRPRLPDDTPVTGFTYGNAPLSAVDQSSRRGFVTYRDGEYSGAPLKTLTWLTNPDVPATAAQVVEAWQHPITSVSADGLVRSGSTGRIVTIDARSLDAAGTSGIATKDFGMLWYAGHYPAGDRRRDIYTAVGMARSFGGWTLSVTVYED